MTLGRQSSSSLRTRSSRLAPGSTMYNVTIGFPLRLLLGHQARPGCILVRSPPFKCAGSCSLLDTSKPHNQMSGRGKSENTASRITPLAWKELETFNSTEHDGRGDMRHDQGNTRVCSGLTVGNLDIFPFQRRGHPRMQVCIQLWVSRHNVIKNNNTCRPEGATYLTPPSFYPITND
jgi:hypothetical protein